MLEKLGLNGYDRRDALYELPAASRQDAAPPFPAPLEPSKETIFDPIGTMGKQTSLRRELSSKGGKVLTPVPIMERTTSTGTSTWKKSQSALPEQGVVAANLPAPTHRILQASAPWGHLVTLEDGSTTCYVAPAIQLDTPGRRWTHWEERPDPRGEDAMTDAFVKVGPAEWEDDDCSQVVYDRENCRAIRVYSSMSDILRQCWRKGEYGHPVPSRPFLEEFRSFAGYKTYKEVSRSRWVYWERQAAKHDGGKEFRLPDAKTMKAYLEETVGASANLGQYEDDDDMSDDPIHGPYGSIMGGTTKPLEGEVQFDVVAASGAPENIDEPPPMDNMDVDEPSVTKTATPAARSPSSKARSPSPEDDRPLDGITVQGDWEKAPRWTINPRPDYRYVCLWTSPSPLHANATTVLDVCGILSHLFTVDGEEGGFETHGIVSLHKAQGGCEVFLRIPSPSSKTRLFGLVELKRTLGTGEVEGEPKRLQGTRLVVDSVAEKEYEDAWALMKAHPAWCEEKRLQHMGPSDNTYLQYLRKKKKQAIRDLDGLSLAKVKTPGGFEGLHARAQGKLTWRGWGFKVRIEESVRVPGRRFILHEYLQQDHMFHRGVAAGEGSRAAVASTSRTTLEHQPLAERMGVELPRTPPRTTTLEESIEKDETLEERMGLRPEARRKRLNSTYTENQRRKISKK